jgi:XTP/dITP diphosphohydrolase
MEVNSSIASPGLLADDRGMIEKQAKVSPPKSPAGRDERGGLSILVASGNPHKVEEIAAVFGEAGISVQSLADLDDVPEEPTEDQPSFMGNALLKARYYARKTGRLCLADDSGLEVDALGGAPGVYSARYAGASGGRDVVDPANNRKLIEQLKGVPAERRSARFICAMALCDPLRTWAQVIGSIEGRIIDTPRGENGFGYDPHFLLPERGVTTAELTPAEKNAVSHRGVATRRMLVALRGICGR